MNVFGNRHLRQVRQALRQGDLQSACHVAVRSGCLQSPGGRRTARLLVERLVQRAARSEANGDLAAAWDDLSAAVLVQPPELLDELSRRQTRLVESTVRHAESSLLRGHTAAVSRSLGYLRKRNIADRRADEIESVCRLVSDAETLSSRGRWSEAACLLEQAQQLRPDLEFIQSRIRVTRQGREAVSELTTRLRHAINDSHWGGGEDLSSRILQIAPNHPMARDAHQHCRMRLQQETTENRPPGSAVTTGDAIEPTDHESFADYVDDTSPGPDRGPDVCQDHVPDEFATGKNEAPPTLRSFMLWIDGVGGYLVCTSPRITIGRAVERAEVDIPLQADIRRRHLRIQRFGSQYIAQPLDDVEVNDQAIREPVVLQNGQIIQMGGGVEARFVLPHPLGCSARIEFVSRHRTEPWSDAVLLMGDALLIGQSNCHHIRAAEVREELMIFRKGDDIVFRSPDEFEVNETNRSGDIALQDRMRIVGPGYSICVEQIREIAGNRAESGDI